MKKDLRNRIVRHVRIRASELVPHELNPRRHSDAQRRALQLLYDEIGFARSLLAYELPDGRLKLIDGHLRASMDPEQEVDVEVLDVTDSEARALLLAIDPLAELAGYERQTLDELRMQAEADSAAVKTLWQTLEEAAAQNRKQLEKIGEPLPQQFLILIDCADEAEQIDLLRRFQEEGLRVSAKTA